MFVLRISFLLSCGLYLRAGPLRRPPGTPLILHAFGTQVSAGKEAELASLLENSRLVDLAGDNDSVIAKAFDSLMAQACLPVCTTQVLRTLLHHPAQR